MGGQALTARLPSLRLVSAWNDPHDARVWSGTVANLLEELEALGALHSYQDATPPSWVVRPVRSWLSRTGRLSASWTLTPEMRGVTGLTSAWARRRQPEGIDGWLLPLGSTGRAARSPYVTWCDMSPTQIAASHPGHSASFGYPEVPDRTLAAVLRSQEAVLRGAHACLAVSAWTARSLVADHGIHPSKVKVVGAGRNLCVTAPPDRDWSTPRFLFAANSWSRKNGDRVVEAFRRLLSEAPGAELHLAGQHPAVDVEGVHGHGPLSFTVPAERERLEQLFRQATCLVMPSWIEPFGIVYVEAAQAGIPSIATSVGGTGTSVGPGGVLVDPADGDGLLDAMRRLSRPEVARQLGDRARARAALFTWRACAERVVRAFAPEVADAEGLAGYLPG